MNASATLAAVIVAAASLTACGESETLVGSYSNELTQATLQKTFPGTTAPPGRWNLEITEHDKVVVNAPDGGGFALAISSLEDDRITLEATGCLDAKGEPAGRSVYDIKRGDDAIRFVKVRDRCAQKDPEAALLTVAPWRRTSTG